jgi:hypothetical protein
METRLRFEYIARDMLILVGRIHAPVVEKNLVKKKERVVAKTGGRYVTLPPPYAEIRFGDRR